MINVKQSDALQISRIWGFYYKHEKCADRTKPLVVPIKDSAIQLALLMPLLFSLFFLLSFHGKSFPWQWWPCCCHAPVPCSSPRARLPWPLGKHLAQFLCPSACPPSGQPEQRDLSPISLRVAVQGQAELPPAESPVVSPPCCCRGSGLPLQII